MILLLGGTSHTSPIALGLAEHGYRVLVSRATDVPLEVGDHPKIQSRCGPLNEDELLALVRQQGIRAIVDATHPYASAIHAAARRVAEAAGIPCLSFVRPGIVDTDEYAAIVAADHTAAAQAAFALGRPVLLTTGSRNLQPYVAESRRTGLPLVVRVLDHRQSLDVCHRAGIDDAHIIAGRGPFSVDDNRRHIRQHKIGVLVTKDSGQPGGTREKLAAAKAEGCAVVLVSRPDWEAPNPCDSVQAIVERLAAQLAADAGK